MICVLVILNSLSIAAQRLGVNHLPLSNVIIDGTLNLEIKPFTSPYVQDTAFLSTSGISSGH